MTIATNTSSPPSQGLHQTVRNLGPKVEAVWDSWRWSKAYRTANSCVFTSSLASPELLCVLFSCYFNIDYDSTELLEGKNVVNLMLLVNRTELPSYRMSAHSEHSHRFLQFYYSGYYLTYISPAPFTNGFFPISNCSSKNSARQTRLSHYRSMLSNKLRCRYVAVYW